MTNNIDAFGLDALPPFLTAAQLVTLGLYPSEDAVYSSRVRGTSPDYIVFSRKAVFPRKSVIDFIHNNIQSGTQPYRPKQKNAKRPRLEQSESNIQDTGAAS